MENAKKLLSLAVVISALMFAAACSKKAARVAPPPPPAPAAPTVSLQASPSEIQPGQSAQLTWSTSNADQVTIAGLGTLPASGSRQVSPENSMTYTAIAKGPGGTQEASARVTVLPATKASDTSLSDADLFARQMQDVFFDYDKYDIRSDQNQTASKDAAFLAQHPAIKVLIEGHCDDRGSDEYNLALGASRADALKKALQQNGVDASRLKTVSYGKEKPFCSSDDDKCWQQNRRDHFSMQQ